MKHLSESLTWIWRSSWVSLLKENTWLARLLCVRCEPELAVTRRCRWWTFHSSLPVSRQEAMCLSQEHKEEVVRFWYGAHEHHSSASGGVWKNRVQRHLLCSVFCDWGKGASAVVKEVEQYKCKSTCETRLETLWLRIVINGTLGRFFSV